MKPPANHRKRGAWSLQRARQIARSIPGVRRGFVLAMSQPWLRRQFLRFFRFKTRESAIAHRYLDGLTGIEIGGAAHSPFGLNTRNVNYTDDFSQPFFVAEREWCGANLPVDVVAPGDDLPLPPAAVDFVIASHVIEHFFDPIKAMQEWLRVVRPGGYILLIVPHRRRNFDRKRALTSIAELTERHAGIIPYPVPLRYDYHYSVWETADFLALCRHMGWQVREWADVDDRIGNGFLVVIQKDSFSSNTA